MDTKIEDTINMCQKIHDAYIYVLYILHITQIILNIENNTNHQKQLGHTLICQQLECGWTINCDVKTFKITIP